MIPCQANTFLFHSSKQLPTYSLIFGQLKGFFELSWPRDGTLVGYIFSKRYKKVSPHRKSHNLLYNLLREKNKPSPEMVNKRGVPIGPTWLIRTLDFQNAAGKFQTFCTRDGTLVGYTFSKRYKKVSPHRKSHNLLYNLLREKNKPPQEMVNKRGVPFGPTWLTRTLGSEKLSWKN